MTARFSIRWIDWVCAVALFALPSQPASGQTWEVVTVSLPHPQKEGTVVFEPIFPGPHKQLLILSERGIDVFTHVPDSTKWHSTGKLQTAGKTGRLGFIRMEMDGPRVPLLLDAEGVWRLSTGQVPEKLMELRPAIPSGPSIHFGVVGLDFDGDGKDELLLPEETGYVAFRMRGTGRPEPVKLPSRLRTPRFTLETDDGLVNPVIPAFRRFDLGRFQGVDTVALLSAEKGNASALVLSSSVDFGTRIRHEILPIKAGPELTGKPESTVVLSTDAHAEDLPIRMADGRIRVVRTRGNLDLLQPRTIVTLHEDSSVVGRWTSRDPMGLGAVQSLAVGQGPSLVLATLSIQAGSVPDLAGMITGKPLNYRLLFFLPTPDGRSWSKEGQPGPELAVVIDPSQPRTDTPFYLNDVTGDGLADIVSRSSLNHIEVYVADSVGVYSSKPAWELNVEADSTIDFVDVNGDGTNELVASSRRASALQIVTVKRHSDNSMLRRLYPQRLLPKTSIEPPEFTKP